MCHEARHALQKMENNLLKFLWRGSRNETITLAVMDERDLKGVLFRDILDNVDELLM